MTGNEKFSFPGKKQVMGIVMYSTVSDTEIVWCGAS